jgi:nitrogen fixation protein NifX
MKVAIASQDLARIDAHLGWARHLMIYEVTAEGFRHLETVSFADGRPDGDPAKLPPRIAAVDGCQMVFVAEVGPEGEFALARQRIVPIRRFAGQPVVAALDALHSELRGSAPGWLRRIEQHYRLQGDDTARPPAPPSDR